MIRQIVCFIVAAAMLGGGLFILYDEAFIAGAISGRVVVIGVFLSMLGGYWLWLDFGKPLWSKLTSAG